MPVVGCANHHRVNAIVGEYLAEIVVRLTSIVRTVFFIYAVFCMVTSYFGYFREPEHTTIFLPEEKSEVTSALFTNADKAKIDGLAWFIGPGAAGDDIGRDHGSCRGDLEELST